MVAAEEVKPEGGKKSKKMLFIIVGALVLILAGAGGAFFMLKKKAPSKTESAKTTVATLEENAAGEEKAPESDSKAKEGETKAEGEKKGEGDKKAEGEGESKGKEGDAKGKNEKMSLVLELAPITTNLNEASVRRFVRAAIWIESSDEKSLESLKDNQYRLKDAILTLLSNKTRADLQTEEGKELLKREVKMRVEQIAGKSSIQTVGFTELTFF